MKDSTAGRQSRPAKPSKPFYRRRLPHYHGDGRPVLVTLATYHRWALPAETRGIVLKHCLHDHGRKMELYCAVVMPDHVHLLFRTKRKLDAPQSVAAGGRKPADSRRAVDADGAVAELDGGDIDRGLPAIGLDRR